MFSEILEYVPYLLLFLFLRSIVRGFLSNRRRAQRAPGAARQTPVQSGGELKKDPVCGTYVSVTVSVMRTVNGQPVYFCSKECCDRYGRQ
jgi:YHS domain-containing protein